MIQNIVSLQITVLNTKAKEKYLYFCFYIFNMQKLKKMFSWAQLKKSVNELYPVQLRNDKKICSKENGKNNLFNCTVKIEQFWQLRDQDFVKAMYSENTKVI